MGYPFFGSNNDFPWMTPPGVVGNIQSFYAPAGAITQWQDWIKPRGITMVSMLLIGGGGGGGGGFTAASTNARGGGAGGASSSIAFHIFPAFVLPDILKVTVGLGGVGGSGSGVNGTAGTNSYVATGVGLTAGSTIPNVIAESNNAAPGGGNAGANSGNATGGSVPTIPTKARQGWAQVVSLSTFTVGIVGATGGSPTAAGTAVGSCWQTIPTCPGSGGGGVTSSGTGFAGGAISLLNAMDYADGSYVPASAYLAGGVAGSGVAVGGQGNSGVQNYKPFVMLGGTGGGSADGQAGGRGGNGGIGCGGGGGGGGTTGGAGGNGGNGIVIISCW